MTYLLRCPCEETHASLVGRIRTIRSGAHQPSRQEQR